MKKISLFFVAIMAMILVAEAQAPERFSYQSVIRDAAGDLVANEPVGVRVSILQYSPDGSAVYCETHNRATNANGLVTMEIGAGTVVSGTNYTLAGTQQMLSVPYALYAAASGNGEGVSQTDFPALVGRVDSLAQIIANLNGGSGSEGGDDNPDDNDTTVTAQPCPGAPTVTDVDGNVYNTVQIGEQCWMRENLKTTKYANGTTIPLGTEYSYDVAYRYYPDNDSANVTDYGYLYNWAAVMKGASASNYNPSGVQGICPDGWHVPSDNEWTELTNYVSSQSQYLCGSSTNKIAKALASETGWNSSTDNCAVGNNPSANNATGFSARPAGDRFSGFGTFAGFWSATKDDYDSYYACDRRLYYGNTNVYRSSDTKSSGFSVRCVRNEEGSGSEGGGDQACPGAPTVTDVDGNVYNTVQIGEQCWMRENLKTTKYANGTTIPLGTDTSSTAAYRYYPNGNSANVTDYGYLYNWPAVMNGLLSSSANPSGVQGICPDGWHVPSDAEWTELENYVSSQYPCGGGSNTSKIAKALASEEGWYSSTYNCAVGNNPDANNATGFSARPAGKYNGDYGNFGNSANFWSASQIYGNKAYLRQLDYYIAYVSRLNGTKRNGYSVRCVRNVEGSGSEGVDDYPDITLSATVYPNPTTDYLTLSLSDNHDLTGLECRIFDGNGKFLDKKAVAELRTELGLTGYATGTYFVNLYRGKQLMKSFKVIKVRE